MKHPRLLFSLAFSATLITACSRQTDPREHLKRGSDYRAHKQYQEAIVELRTAIQIDPNLAEARAKLADAYIATGDGVAALREAVRAADLLPNDVAAQVRAGNLLLLAQSFDDANARADRALAKDKKNSDALLLKGSAQAGLRNFDEALDKYEAAIADRPGEDLGYIGVGTIELERGNGRLAEGAFKRALAANPKSVAAHMSLANLYWESQKLNLAESELKAAYELDGKNRLVNRALAFLYLATARPAQAEPHFIALAQSTGSVGDQLTLANYYFARNRYDDARRILQAKTLAGSDHAATLLARVDLLDGKEEEARKKVDAVLAKSPRSASALVLKGELLFRAGKYDQALSQAAAALAAEPGNTAGPHLLAGTVQLAMNKTPEATASYEAALRSRGINVIQSFEANTRLAAIHLKAGAPEKATTYVQAALAERPSDVSGQLLAARVELARGELRSARKRLTALQMALGKTTDLELLRGEIELAAKQPDAATAAFAGVLKSDPVNITAIDGLTRLDWNAGRQKEAIARIEAAMQRKPVSAALSLLAAESYARVGDASRAERSVRAALERDPTQFSAYSLLAQILASQKRLPEAIKEFEGLLASNPKSVVASAALGVLLDLSGRTADAEKMYEQTLAIEPRAVIAANNLAWLLTENGRSLDRALQLAQTARQQLPENPEIADTLGWVLVNKKLGQEAIPLLEFSVNARPRDPAMHYHLGMAYKLAGQSTKARRTLGRALELNDAFTGSAQVRKALAAL